MTKKPEQALHEAVARFLDIALPIDAFWTTFPAGGGGKARGGQLKAMGLKAGVPDILIVWQGLAFWIELKAPRGVLSAEQRLVHDRLAFAGCERPAVCRSVDDVERALRAREIPIRASVGAAA